MRRVSRGDRVLADLEFLNWEAQIWRMVRRWDAARDLLAFGWAQYALWLIWDDRRREASGYAQRVVEVARTWTGQPQRLSATLEPAIHVTGLFLRRSPIGPEGSARAVEYLHSWLGNALPSDLECAIYRDMAENAWFAGRRAAALEFADHAQRLAERSELPDALRATRALRVDLFLQTGQAQKALPLLIPVEEHPLAFHQVLESMRWVMVLYGLGAYNEAADHLAQTYALIECHQYLNFLESADVLARRF
jgi:hypothetical protein